MKYIVFSDSHGRKSFMEEALDKERFDGIIHLGDGYDDLDDIANYYQYKAIIRVCGNCDRIPNIPIEGMAEVEGVKFIYCHGHNHNVKWGGKDFLSYYARENNAQVLMFGHTHEQYCKTEGGVLLLNPGTIQTGYYAVIEFRNGKAKAELKEID